MAASLNAGAKAPDFSLPNDSGGHTALRDFRGRKLVLFFYPKADTAGCTREAQDFTRLAATFAKSGTDIVGVSADPVKALDRFKTKRGLKVTLASDETLETLKAYGVWVKKSMYGRTFMGVQRTTFLIAADGRIARIWDKVKVEGHAAEVLAAAKEL
jgi:thioredoxin-dependent peroxiredoxin